MCTNESFTPVSPASQELQEFEAYNRTALPQLVEAHLQAIISPEMKPIEESLRVRFVDIVRRCQSTVEENFRIARGSKAVTRDSNQLPASQLEQNVSFRQDQTSASAPENSVTDFFHEPPHVATGENNPFATLPPNINAPDPLPSQSVDSTYGSLPEPCGCVCHLCSANACEDCLVKNCDSKGFRFEGWMNPP